MLFCATVTSTAWAAVRERGWFAVTILGRQDAELALRFAGQGDRFAGVRRHPAHQGVPALAGALAVLTCDVTQEHPAGDHTVVLARVRVIYQHCDRTGLDTVSLGARARQVPAQSAGHAACEGWPCVTPRSSSAQLRPSQTRPAIST